MPRKSQVDGFNETPYLEVAFFFVKIPGILYEENAKIPGIFVVLNCCFHQNFPPQNWIVLGGPKFEISWKLS